MKTIIVDGQEFTRVGTEGRGGKIQKEFYFASDRSNVHIVVDYSYVAKDNQ